jgi:hypothetical protein
MRKRRITPPTIAVGIINAGIYKFHPFFENIILLSI